MYIFQLFSTIFQKRVDFRQEGCYNSLQMDKTDYMLTVQQVAGRLSCSDKTIYERIQRQEITASKLGGTYRIREEWLTEYIEKNKLRGRK